jgi:hypothetical protein
MGPEIAAPLTVFGAVVAIVWVAMAYGSRNRGSFYETVRAAIERGTELTPETVRALGAPRSSQYSDIKWGLIWIAVAAACFTFGWSVSAFEPDEDVFRAFLGIGSFPLFVGLALLGYGVVTAVLKKS